VTVRAEVFRDRQMPCLPLLSHGNLYALVETPTRGSRVIRMSEAGQELQTIVPATRMPIRQLVIAKDRIFVGLFEGGTASIDCWSLEGDRLPSVSVPPSGSIQLLPGHGEDPTSLFFSFESFDTPPIIYEHIVGSETSTPWWQREIPKASNRYDVQEVEVISKDSTTFPMTLVALTDRVRNKPLPMIMTSYGGFGALMTPRFSVLVTILLELGAAFALPRIRGGGEFGKTWHDAGRLRNRQAAFDDFISAAEWLCRNNLTRPDQLGIFGGSNAGLLVGVAMTQRPDLFGAVLCIAPLLDMLRYECFDRAVDWRREYGTTADPRDFEALHDYSPYHHIAGDMNYPASMFVSGDKDDRCNPAHVRKMVAALQQRSAQVAPILCDHSEERGHSPVLPLSIRISALARRIAFLCRELNISVREEPSNDSPCD
jgi:prolyl oligopeptidase